MTQSSNNNLNKQLKELEQTKAKLGVILDSIDNLNEQQIVLNQCAVINRQILDIKNRILESNLNQMVDNEPSQRSQCLACVNEIRTRPGYTLNLCLSCLNADNVREYCK